MVRQGGGKSSCKGRQTQESNLVHDRSKQKQIIHIQLRRIRSALGFEEAEICRRKFIYSTSMVSVPDEFLKKRKNDFS